MTETARTLLVFAHADEASAFADVEHLVTGVGKVNAATQLGYVLAQGNVSRVVVLGTAGVVAEDRERIHFDTVYHMSAVLQHDFSLPSDRLIADSELSFTRDSAVLATGDVFVKSAEQRAHIASLGADLVDMEAYAYASVCERFAVPWTICKVASDFADTGTTDEEWDAIVNQKSVQLREFAERSDLAKLLVLANGK